MKKIITIIAAALIAITGFVSCSKDVDYSYVLNGSVDIKAATAGNYEICFTLSDIENYPTSAVAITYKAEKANWIPGAVNVANDKDNIYGSKLATKLQVSNAQREKDAEWTDKFKIEDLIKMAKEAGDDYIYFTSDSYECTILKIEIVNP